MRGSQRVLHHGHGSWQLVLLLDLDLHLGVAISYNLDLSVVVHALQYSHVSFYILQIYILQPHESRILHSGSRNGTRVDVARDVGKPARQTQGAQLKAD